MGGAGSKAAGVRGAPAARSRRAATAALVLTLVCLPAEACGPEAGAEGGGAGVMLDAQSAAQAGRAPQAAPAAVVDSVFPMDVMLERFRAGIAAPARLTSGAGSRDSLVVGVVRALEAGDTLAFERLGVSLPEWAWLYFPASVQARPPYELPPALAWFQLQEANRKGILRLLGRLGSAPLDYRGYRCDPEPVVEAENRLWTGCLLTVARRGEEPAAIRLFSAILERDGRFAVLSWANDY